jgi:hypothetical protein
MESTNGPLSSAPSSSREVEEGRREEVQYMTFGIGSPCTYVFAAEVTLTSSWAEYTVELRYGGRGQEDEGGRWRRREEGEEVQILAKCVSPTACKLTFGIGSPYVFAAEVTLTSSWAEYRI